ncbi:MAG: hypothetical protein MUC80_08035 [Candidatus Thermoplasmatota archaeon]|jgi:uncharacterized membrane protein|nr:hypothetical protein [Candidatus Thermoplasmatota archaeon]
MDKKPLIVVSICAVVLLVMGSMNTVVGYQTIKTTQKGILKERIKQTRFLQNNFNFRKSLGDGYLFMLFLYLIAGIVSLMCLPIAIFSGISSLFFMIVLTTFKGLGMSFNNSIFYRFVDALSLISLSVFVLAGLYIGISLFWLLSFITAILMVIFDIYPYSLSILINRMVDIYRKKSIPSLENGYG